VTPRPRLHLVTRRALLGGAAKLAAVGAGLAALAACATKPAASPGEGRPPQPPNNGGSPGTAEPAEAEGAGAAASGNLEHVELAFCSQVLCVLPYEVARQRGYWAAEGLDVNLVYMRGGTQAINALLANSVDWVGTPIDLVVQTVAKGKQAVMIASTSRLPFFALVVGPRAGDLRGVKDLAGKKIGVANLGTTDQLMAQYLLTKEGVNPDSVEFVALGPNLYDQVVRGQVEAGMVQEPSLTLIERAGGRVLVNFMKLDDTQRFLGGPYQFMGLNTRPDVLATKAATGEKLVRGLIRANQWILENPGAAIVRAAPEDIVAGGDVEVFAAALDRYKADLYPADGKLVADSIQRVIDVQQQSGAIEPGQTVRADQVFTNQYLPGA
jgi:NitT/TauT family transport system substrate-binding protein